jgi:hypothetical protein
MNENYKGLFTALYSPFDTKRQVGTLATRHSKTGQLNVCQLLQQDTCFLMLRGFLKHLFVMCKIHRKLAFDLFSVNNSIEQSLSKNLTSLQLLKKFPALYGTRRFITAFTRARHLSISWARLIQSMPPIPHLEDPFQHYSPIYLLVFQVVVPSVFPTKTLYAPSIPPYALRALPILVFLIWPPLLPHPSWAQIFSSAPH